jgi:cytochrome P450
MYLKQAIEKQIEQVQIHLLELEMIQAWNLLKKNPITIATAVEEILRWTTPVMHSMRVATQNIKLRDQIIFKGETVTLWNNSANRDTNVFIDPFTFNINRTRNRHLTFGWGPHHCLGATIARLELKILFQEIIKRQYKITLTNSPKLVRSNVMAGYKHLPIKIH